MEQALDGHEYLVADRFTAADISVAYALMLSRMLGLHKTFSPTLQAYWSRLQQREAFQAAKRIQKEAMEAIAA